MEMIFNQEKLAELILFFAQESQSDPYFGSTKLNKLLFMTDFLAYGNLGKPVTGIACIHQVQGPAPLPGDFLTVREQLETAGRLVIREQMLFGFAQKRPVAQANPNLALFTQDELDIARHALDTMRTMTNQEASTWSHQRPGWLSTKQGEEIPYYTVVLWDRTPPTFDDLTWAEQMIAQLELV